MGPPSLWNVVKCKYLILINLNRPMKLVATILDSVIGQCSFRESDNSKSMVLLAERKNRNWLLPFGWPCRYRSGGAEQEGSSCGFRQTWVWIWHNNNCELLNLSTTQCPDLCRASTLPAAPTTDVSRERRWEHLAELQMWVFLKYWLSCFQELMIYWGRGKIKVNSRGEVQDNTAEMSPPSNLRRTWTQEVTEVQLRLECGGTRSRRAASGWG